MPKELAPAKVTITYHESKGWLSIEKTGEGAQQRLTVSVDASRMKPKHGVYRAAGESDLSRRVESRSMCFAFSLPFPATSLINVLSLIRIARIVTSHRTSGYLPVFIVRGVMDMVEVI